MTTRACSDVSTSVERTLIDGCRRLGHRQQQLQYEVLSAATSRIEAWISAQVSSTATEATAFQQGLREARLFEGQNVANRIPLGRRLLDSTASIGG
jgi:hypothetical protein